MISLRELVVFLLFFFAFQLNVVSQKVIHIGNGVFNVLEEDLDQVTEFVDVPVESSGYFTTNSDVSTFYELGRLFDDFSLPIFEYDTTTGLSDTLSFTVGGNPWGLSMINDSLLMVMTGLTIYKFDLVDESIKEVSVNSTVGGSNPILSCFECMGSVFCHSLELGSGRNKIWDYDIEQDTFSFLFNVGVGLHSDFGCAGNELEFAKLVVREVDTLRVFSWMDRKPIDKVGTGVTGGYNGFGLEVKNYPFSLLMKNDEGARTDRQTIMNLEICDTKKIPITLLEMDIINEGVAIDSMMISVISAPEDFTVSIDTTNLSVTRIGDDTFMIYNYIELSNERLVNEFSNGFFKLDSVPQTDTITLEISMNSFLYKTSKTVTVALNGSPPCDEWGTSTSNLEESFISLYPNPTTGLIHFDEKLIGRSMRILSTYGETVETRFISKSRQDFSQLPSGVYFVHFSDDDNGVVELIKFVKY